MSGLLSEEHRKKLSEAAMDLTGAYLGVTYALS